MKNRIFDFDEYMKKRFGFFKNSRVILTSNKGRIVKERPKDALKQALLAKIDKSRMERMLKSGELKSEGPRIWRLKLCALE